MPGDLLTTASSILCPHGGKATLLTANVQTFAGDPVLLESDIHAVTGCAFTLPGPKPSPCIRIEWSAGSTTATVGGKPVLVKASVGECYSPENALQGTAVIVNTQMKASAQ